MSFLERMCEQRVSEAMARGEFDDLPGYGKPIPNLPGGADREDQFVPEDLRMAHKILRDAGFLPPEMSIRKELFSLNELLACTIDTEHRASILREINDRSLRLNLMYKRAVYLDYPQFTAERRTR